MLMQTSTEALCALKFRELTLTVTANHASKVYGTANPSLADTVTGFVNGDTVSVVSGSASLNTTATASLTGN